MFDYMLFCIVSNLVALPVWILVGWAVWTWQHRQVTPALSASDRMEVEWEMECSQEWADQVESLLAAGPSIRETNYWKFRALCQELKAERRRRASIDTIDTITAETALLSSTEQSLVGCPVEEASDLDIAALVVSIDLSPFGELPLSQEEEFELAFWDAGFVQPVFPAL